MVDAPAGDVVSERDENRVVAARRRLVELLSEDGHLLPGGVIERTMRCGKPNCRCTGDAGELHGPYHQWGYSRGGRRHTRRLSDPQLERYGAEIERGRRLSELLAELEDAELGRVEHAEGWGREPDREVRNASTRGLQRDADDADDADDAPMTRR